MTFWERTQAWAWSTLCSLLVTALVACTAEPPDSVTGAVPTTDGTSTQPAGDLIVFAAASLTEAFTEIEAEFEAAHPGVEVLLNFAGSQQLAQQLAQGAPADVFASANNRQMDIAIEAGRVVSGTPRTFAHNRLVVIYPQGNPAAITSLQDLARPGIKLVLAAPEVPVGGYTLDFLETASTSTQYGESYNESVLANVVSYEQNVKAVLSKILLGEADAGVVYSSDVSLGAANQMERIDIPDELNTMAAYPVAPIADAENPDATTAFVNYVLAPEGQGVLAVYGLIPAIEFETNTTPETTH